MPVEERELLPHDRGDADHLKDEFLAMLAHELRNPLAPIRNALHLIRIADFDPKVAVENWAIVDRQVAHLVRLVDDLLDVSRIRQSKILLRKERLDLADVIARAVESSRPLIEAGAHTLNVELPQEPLTLEGDLVRLVQVLSNLLNNAAKYTPERGHIDLRVEPFHPASADHQGSEPPAWVNIRVCDNGMGIPAEMLPRLFDLYSQHKRTLSRAEGGLGIGLTLVRQLTELHGGEVRAFSAGPGKGSEFNVLLPLAPSLASCAEVASPTKLGASSTERSLPPVLARRRVLIVDDNEDSVATMGQLLAILGHDVRILRDGVEALALAAAFRPEVILLDIGLPGVDGYEVARRLRADTQFRGVLLIALTGYGSPEDRQQSRNAGFNAHLVKPVDLEALKQMLSAPEALVPGESAERRAPQQE